VHFIRCATLLLWAIPSLAEQGILVVHIADVYGHPIGRIRFRAGADSSISSPRETADNFGAVRIRLAPQTKSGDVVMLEVVGVPKGKDPVMISPWNEWVLVPPFENEAKNFVPVVMVERGDKHVWKIQLACVQLPRGLTRPIRRRRPANQPLRSSAGRPTLAAVARSLGSKPEEIDQAIRA
jgi:hypothetical protein